MSQGGPMAPCHTQMQGTPNSETLDMKRQASASILSIPTFLGPKASPALLRPPCQQHTVELQRMPIHARLIHSWELLHPHQFLAACYLPRSPRHHTLAAAFLWSCYEPGDAPAARGQHSLHPGLHGAQPTSLCCAGNSWTLLSWLCFSRGFRARGGDRGPRAGDALAWGWTLPPRACGKAGQDTAPAAESQPSFARGTWSGWGADGHSPIVRFCLMLAAQGACMDPEQLAGWAATECCREGECSPSPAAGKGTAWGWAWLSPQSFAQRDKFLPSSTGQRPCHGPALSKPQFPVPAVRDSRNPWSRRSSERLHMHRQQMCLEDT